MTYSQPWISTTIFLSVLRIVNVQFAMPMGVPMYPPPPPPPMFMMAAPPPPPPVAVPMPFPVPVPVMVTKKRTTTTTTASPDDDNENGNYVGDGKFAMGVPIPLPFGFPMPFVARPILFNPPRGPRRPPKKGSCSSSSSDSDDSDSSSDCSNYRRGRRRRIKHRMRIHPRSLDDEYRARFRRASGRNNKLVKPVFSYVSEQGQVKFQKQISEADADRLMEDSDRSQNVEISRRSGQASKDSRKVIFRAPPNKSITNLSVSFNIT